MYTIYFCIGFDYFDECLILISDYYLYKEVFFLFIFGLDKYKVIKCFILSFFGFSYFV